MVEYLQEEAKWLENKFDKGKAGVVCKPDVHRFHYSGSLSSSFQAGN